MLSGGQATGTLDSVVHAMLDKSRKKLIMASLKSMSLMAWAFANDKVETEDGGANITNPLIVGRNPNVGSYQYYDPVPMAQTNEFTTIKYGWSRVAGSMIISDQEQDENTGKDAIFKILKSKLDILEESIKEKFSSYLYGVGGGTDPLGLASLIPDDPTTGTLGTLSRVTELQWRSSMYQFSGGLDPTNIAEAFDDVLMDLTLKGEAPDIILMGRNIMRIYRQAVRDQVMINISDTKAGKAMYDLGFKGFTHGGTTCLYDEDCGVNRAYFINSKYLRMHILKGVNMRVKELVAPWNIDAVGRRVVWQGQWCVWRAFRTHAVVRNGTTG